MPNNQNNANIQEINNLNNSTPTLTTNRHINCKYSTPEDIPITNHNVTCLSMNIRSTDKNLNRLKILLDDLQKNPDIILLQEIWQDNLNFKIAQYKKFTTTRIGKKGGGTAILIKDSFKPSEIKELTYIKNTIEITTISAKINNKKYIISSIYRPAGMQKESITVFSITYRISLKHSKIDIMTILMSLEVI